MPSDYEAITRHNERQLGLDTASRKTQICMYSDSTHFVYELLQNADDHGASKVIFKLSSDELVVEHDGEPFTEENVKAITYFGKSTSRDDLVKTGRFGVGFKSVFAFTATPTVMSGEEHFQIYDLYRIREHPYPDGFSRSCTRITLPFTHESEQPDYVEDLMTRKEAYSSISARLTQLNMNSLLFTMNIREIQWEIDGRSGHYLRQDATDDTARRTTITDGEELKEYLVFSRVPKWRNQQFKAVEVAFALAEKEQLSRIDDFLYVLFATTQETHLAFILNGPYRTNPSRETISEEDPFNVHLLMETCALIEEALPLLRDRNLLTTQFLSVLPNGTDRLRSFYAPILDAIIKTFHDQKLVPTDDDEYARSGDVFQGPAQLREVITKMELGFFLGSDSACWAKGVQQNSRADQFLRGLEIERWGWEKLQEALQDRYDGFCLHDDDDPDMVWLAERSDSWLQDLYVLLAGAIKKGECDSWRLQNCCIIRVRIDGEEDHVVGPYARFPKRGYRALPQVKRTVLRGRNQQGTERIQESLVALGVSEIGDEERIDVLLETFYSDEADAVTGQQHLQHMKTFIKSWKKGQNVSKFRGYAAFRVAGEDSYHRSKDCYLDAPLRKSGLHALYARIKSGVPQKSMLWSGYRKLASEGFCDFAVACGVTDRLAIEIRSCNMHPMHAELMEGLGRAYKTPSGIDADYRIPNLAAFLNLKSRDVNRLIWQTVSKADPNVLEAEYRPNQKYEMRTQKSSLILELTNAEWIPDKRGRLRKPCELTKEKLHRDFKYDNRNGWLDEIGFGEIAKKENQEYERRKERASSLGVPVEVVDLFSELPEQEREKEWEAVITIIKEKWKQRKRAQRDQQDDVLYHQALEGAFSESGRSSSNNGGEANGGTSRNPSRRRGKIAEDIATAIENEGKRGDQSSLALRKKWKGKNDQVRVALAKWYGGRCQVCQKTFIQRSGEPYFEGLYLVPYTTAKWLDRVGNVLCLCPWHSAMFQFGPKHVDENIIDQIMRLKVQAEGGDGRPTIRMRLCDSVVEIKFAENHLIDLQEMIRADQESDHEQDGPSNSLER